MAEERWRAVAALVDPSRRALYDHVRHQDHPVTREEAAEATGMSRNLVAFHLDKLVDVGLLRTSYRAASDRPRARGRTPKVYRADPAGVAITVPERRYELIAEILADTVADPGAGGEVGGHAARHGQELGRTLRAGADPVDLMAVLAGLGFEPRTHDDGAVALHNCPFHALVSRHRELVCGLNHAFLTGLLAGLAATGVRPGLARRPGACCVELLPDDQVIR